MTCPTGNRACVLPRPLEPALTHELAAQLCDVLRLDRVVPLKAGLPSFHFFAATLSGPASAVDPSMASRSLP